MVNSLVETYESGTMSDTSPKKWLTYILLFVVLWAGNFAISLWYRLSSEHLGHILWLDAYRAALVSAALYFLLPANSRKKG